MERISKCQSKTRLVSFAKQTQHTPLNHNDGRKADDIGEDFGIVFLVMRSRAGPNGSYVVVQDHQSWGLDELIAMWVSSF